MRSFGDAWRGDGRICEKNAGTIRRLRILLIDDTWACLIGIGRLKSLRLWLKFGIGSGIRFLVRSKPCSSPFEKKTLQILLLPISQDVTGIFYFRHRQRRSNKPLLDKISHCDCFGGSCETSKVLKEEWTYNGLYIYWRQRHECVVASASIGLRREVEKWNNNGCYAAQCHCSTVQKTHAKAFARSDRESCDAMPWHLYIGNGGWLEDGNSFAFHDLRCTL